MKPHPVFVPLSWLYGLGVEGRNWLFEHGLLPVSRIPRPVISVGNILAGGSGKTPLVLWLARRLMQRGKRVGVLSRGYGRRTRGYVLVSVGNGPLVSATEAGDEPVEIATRLPEALVAVDEKRVRGAQKLVAEQKADIIILDDGFQHRFLYRDVDIVVMPAHWDRREYLLPAGMLREPVSSLRRADLLVVTRCREENDLERVRQAIAPGKPMLGMKTVVRSVVELGTAEAHPPEFLRGKKVLLLSGIAEPEAFHTTVTECGAVVVGRSDFPDHHWFSRDDINRITRESERAGAELVLTTWKDAMRLSMHMQSWKSPALFVLQIEFEPMVGLEHLEKTLSMVKGGS